MFPAIVEGSDINVQPGMVLNEEYNDNIFLTRNNRVDDYISTVSPSLRFVSKSPLWDWDVAYVYNYRYYANRSVSDDNSQNLNLANNTRVIDGYVFWNIKDTYTRVSLNPARDFTLESNIVNQTDTNVFFANPYFVLGLTDRSALTAGYGYSNTWYKDPQAADSTENIGYMQIRRELSSRLTVTGEIRYNDQDFHQNGLLISYKQEDVSLDSRYEYAENSFLFLKIGNSWFDFGDGRKNNQRFWDAGIVHKHSTMTYSLETVVTYIPDPILLERRLTTHQATIRRDTDRSSFSMSGGMRRYRDLQTGRVQNVDYFVTTTLNHEMGARTRIIIDATVDHLDDRIAYTSLTRYLGGVRLERRSSENLTIAAAYRYSSVYSPDVYSLGYYDNRVILELQKVF